MSFSVQAVDSGPSSPSASWGPRNDPTLTSGKKVTVCSAYFQTANCPNGSSCDFAHCMQELDGAVQVKLVGLMGEQLPLHFIAPPPPLDPVAEEQRAFNAFFNIHQQKQHQQQHHQHSAVFGGGVSSSASSSSSASAQDSPTLASVTPAAGVTQPRKISIGLPQRCQYPHAVPGTYYDFINVKRKCLTEDVEEAYRKWRSVGYKAAKTIDPAKADAMDRLIVDAKNVLSNPSIRAEYDASLPARPTSLCPQQQLQLQQSKAIATPAVAPLFEDGIWN